MITSWLAAEPNFANELVKTEVSLRCILVPAAIMASDRISDRLLPTSDQRGRSMIEASLGRGNIFGYADMSTLASSAVQTRRCCSFLKWKLVILWVNSFKVSKSANRRRRYLRIVGKIETLEETSPSNCKSRQCSGDNLHPAIVIINWPKAAAKIK